MGWFRVSPECPRAVLGVQRVQEPPGPGVGGSAALGMEAQRAGAGPAALWLLSGFLSTHGKFGVTCAHRRWQRQKQQSSVGEGRGEGSAEPEFCSS